MYQFNYLRALQLRRSAGDSGGTAPTGDAGGTAEAEAGKEQGHSDEKQDGAKAFTQADVDKIVSQTIAKERAKAEKAVASAKTEAEKLATMSAEQRAAHEQEEREAKLAAREAEINHRELRAAALQTLAEKQMPTELAEVLDYADADECNASIASVEKVFRAAVQKGVEERMKGKTPADGGKETQTKQQASGGLQGAVGAYYKKG